jgi:hypothetical protein
LNVKCQIRAAITALLLLSTAVVQAALIPFTATIDGAQANKGAGTGSSATGTARLILDDVTNLLIWDINWQLNPSSTAAHIHGPASPTTNAGVKINLGNQTGIGTATLDDSEITDLKNGLWYVNIHSGAFPGGEIRGQLTRAALCDEAVVQRKITQPEDDSRWHLLSLPCDAPFNSTMADLINDTSVSNDPTKWSAFTYLPDTAGSGQYQPLDKDAPIPAAGTGFWFISSVDVTLTLPEGSAKSHTDTDPPCDSGEACAKQIIDAQSAWNLLGNPTSMNVRHEEMQLVNTSTALNCTTDQPCSIIDSSIDASFFQYNEYAQTYLPFNSDGAVTDQTPGKSIAKPWDGYWVRLAPTDSNAVLSEDWMLYSREFPSQYMFVTDGIFRGDFGGIASAAAACNAEAFAAGLPGEYLPWISAGSVSPSTSWTQLTTPYLRPDGTPIAQSYADLTDSTILAPIRVTPELASISSWVWAHTLSDGTARSSTGFTITGCRDFTYASFVDPIERAGIGNTRNFPQGWSESGTLKCSLSIPIYCAAQ